jgi:hypothetical protein
VNVVIEAAAACSACSGSPVAQLVCDPWGTVNGFMAWLSYTLWSLIQMWWPLLTVVAVLALTAGALLTVVVRRARAEAAEQASWVEITPPAVMPAEGAQASWRAVRWRAGPLGTGTRSCSIWVTWRPWWRKSARNPASCSVRIPRSVESSFCVDRLTCCRTSVHNRPKYRPL